MLVPSAGERILDIGAGKGDVAERVMETSNGAEVHAVEPNEKRVASMKRNHPAIKSTFGSAERLPYPDAFFDKAYTTMALHHFTDIDAALREAARVLKRGGSFVILEVEPRSAVGRMFRFFGRLAREHMTIMTEEQLLSRLGTAEGLEIVASTKLGSSYLIQLRRL